jgi:SAM-dependent methyltransferase
MTENAEFFEANKQLWNERTRIHLKSPFYDVTGFASGKEVLSTIELSEIGDVKGKAMLHLQCHFGLDTLAWARHGAMVTGIDFSDAAISEAKKLAADTQLSAEFICCDVYDTTHHLGERKYDIVFTSYGVIGWLPDLDTWAAVIRHHLKKGGLFYMVEFHPVVWMFDDEFTEIKYPYDNAGVIVTEENGSYADRYSQITGKEYGWNHSLSEVINALLQNGLQIEGLNEFSFSPHQCFKNMVPAGIGRWQIRGFEDKIPMVYSIRARG